MPSKRRSIALKVACVIPVMTTSETQPLNAPEGALWKLVSTDPRGEHSIRAPLLAEINLPLAGELVTALTPVQGVDLSK